MDLELKYRIGQLITEKLLAQKVLLVFPFNHMDDIFDDIVGSFDELKGKDITIRFHIDPEERSFRLAVHFHCVNPKDQELLAGLMVQLVRSETFVIASIDLSDPRSSFDWKVYKEEVLRVSKNYQVQFEGLPLGLYTVRLIDRKTPH